MRHIFDGLHSIATTRSSSARFAPCKSLFYQQWILVLFVLVMNGIGGDLITRCGVAAFEMKNLRMQQRQICSNGAIRSSSGHHHHIAENNDNNVEDMDTSKNELTTHHAPTVSRRSLLFTKIPAVAGITSSGLLTLSSSSSMTVANAAAPITIQDTDNFNSRLQRAMRDKPPKILRRKIKLEFAVLLMRSSYQALDQIDCVAMVRLYDMCLLKA